MKLFLVTRADLPPGDQAVQAVHAALEHASRGPVPETVVLLAETDEETLWDLLSRLERHGYPVTGFTEPDLGGALTALATTTGGRLLRRLPLAFSQWGGGE